MRRLRWLVLATHVPPGGALGGVVRYTTELVAALGRRDDVALHVLAASPAVATLQQIAGPRAVVHVARPLPTAVASLCERYLPLRGHFDVVQGVKHLVPRRSGALTVLTVHDTTLLDRPHDFGPAKRLLLPGPYRASLRQADVLLHVSRATAGRAAVHVASAPARSAVVPLATAPSLLTATAEPVPALAQRRFALVVGDASPRKNLGVVVDAWPQVLAAVPDAVLAVAGPPSWGRTEQGQRYRGLVASGTVLPLGRLSDAQLRWAYEHARLTLCPSLVEGFGLPVVEALDLGSPVAISCDAALVEAAGGRAAAVLPAADVDGWVAAAVAAFTAPVAAHRPAVPSRPRTWDDVAEETVAAVRRRLT